MAILSYCAIGLGVVLAAFAAYHAWRQIPVSIALLGGAAAYELLLIAQLITYAVALYNAQPADGTVLVAYLIACVVIPPIAMAWGLSDSSRWGAGVVAIGMLTAAFLSLRVLDVWAALPSA